MTLNRAQSSAGGGTSDLASKYTYAIFIDHGLMYSEWAGPKIVSLSMRGIAKNI